MCRLSGDGGRHPPTHPPRALLYDVAGQVEEVRRHVDEVVQDAVLLLVVGHAPLALLTLGPRIATLAQALVGLHTHSSVAAGWLTFGCSKWREKQTQMSSGILACIHAAAAWVNG